MTTPEPGTAPEEPVVIVPVELPAPRRRHRPVLAAGLGVAGALAALTACGPTSSAPPPTYRYTPPTTTAPPPPPRTTSRTTTARPRTTEETTTTTTPPPAGSYGGGRVGGGSYTQPCLPTRIPKGYVCTCNCVPD